MKLDTKDVFRTLWNIYHVAFCEYNQQFSAANYFCKKLLQNGQLGTKYTSGFGL